MSRFSSRGGANVVSAPNGVRATASFTPAAGAYSANDIMDVAQEFVFSFTDGKAIPEGSLIHVQAAIIRINVNALQASEAAYELQCYGVTPPSAQADNAAWTLASGDLAAYLGAIALGTPVDLGEALFIKSSVDVLFKLTEQSMFGQLRTLAGFTPTAVARQVELLGTIV